VDSAFQVLRHSCRISRCGPRHPTPGTCLTARWASRQYPPESRAATPMPRTPR